MFSSGRNGFQYWLLLQPYPFEDYTKENVSILASNDGSSWVVPPGVANPLDLPCDRDPISDVCKSAPVGHLNDGYLYYDSASDQLWAYYLWTDFSAPNGGMIHVLRRTSSDGVQWSGRQDLFQVVSYTALSPNVEKVGGTYYMWSVNSGTAGCNATSTTTEYRTSPDGVNWSLPQPANIAQPGFVIWHIEVETIPSKQEYWMLVAAYPNGTNCGSTQLFLARSTDGVNWTTYQHPLLTAGSGWDNGKIYRPAFVYDPAQDVLKVWYSANSKMQEWHMGFTQGNYTDILRSLQ